MKKTFRVKRQGVEKWVPAYCEMNASWMIWQFFLDAQGERKSFPTKEEADIWLNAEKKRQEVA